MFSSKIYKSWKNIQKDKYENIFDSIKFELRNKRILDIGSGSCYLEEFLSNRDIRNIIALDINKEMIRQSNIDTPIIVADGNELPFKNSVFDLVISIDSIHLIEKNDFKRVLRKNGFVLLSTFFNKENYEEKKNLLKEKIKSFEITKEFAIEGKENEYFVLAQKKVRFKFIIYT